MSASGSYNLPASHRDAQAEIERLAAQAHSGWNKESRTLSWFGLMAPAGTPRAIVERVNRETLQAMAQPDVRKKLTDLGLDIITGTPAEFTAAIERETPRWASVIKRAGIKATE